MRSALLLGLLFFIVKPSIALAQDKLVHQRNFDSRAEHAFLLDYDTATVLFSKGGQARMTPSSMSKLMTIYLLFKQLQNGGVRLEDEYVVSEKAWRTGGSRTFLNLGSRVQVKDLLRGIIVQSGNDASVVVAEGIAGAEEYFVDDMNKAAAELGLKNSTFTNATGWPDVKHKMSAEDLAILALRLIKDFPEYYHYFVERDFTYNKVTQPNRNTLLGALGVDGLKTGHTEEGGYGVVVSALQGGVRLIAVVNGLKSSKERSVEAERLLLYGFNSFKQHLVAKAGSIVGKILVLDGEALNVDVSVKEDVKLMLPKVLSVNQIEVVVVYKELARAPIKQGEHAGELQIKYGEQVLKTVPIYAASDVESASFLTRIWRKIRAMWSAS